MCPCDFDGLTKSYLICAHRLREGCDRLQVLGALDLGRGWVELVGHLLEPARSRLDLVVCVCPIVITSSSKEPVELRSQLHGVQEDRVVPGDVEDADLQQRSVGGWSDEHRQVFMYGYPARRRPDGVRDVGVDSTVLRAGSPIRKQTTCLV